MTRIDVTSHHTLRWTCANCGQHIADGTGSVSVTMRDVYDTIAHFKSWEAEHVIDGVTAGRSWNAMPHAVQWQPKHYKCDGASEATSYWIAVERIGTLAEAIGWSAHLMQKTWLRYTDWHEVLEDIAAKAAVRP